MQLAYDTYTWDVGAVEITNGQDTVWNDAGQPQSEKRWVDIHGYLSGDSQDALTQASSGMQTALTRQFRDLVFFQDDGQPSAISLYNAGSISGVRILGFHFPEGNGAEYVNRRAFAFRAEAEYPVSGFPSLLRFTETLSFSGGDPHIVHKPSVNGSPQKQLVYPSTVFEVTQSGEAVGYLAPPIVPTPKWPQALKRRRISKVTPQRMGNGYQGFGRSWSYDFESATPLAGDPTLWTG